MADDEKNTTENANGADEGTSKPQAGNDQKGKKQSLDDLKAKLGIVTKTQKSEAVQETPKRTTSEDFDFSLNAPGQASETVMEDSGALDLSFKGDKKGLAARWIIGIAVLAVLTLGIGAFFGKVMKERSIENFKTKEAAYILGYLTSAKGEELGASEGTVLEVLKAHIEDTTAVFSALQKATDPQARLEAQQQMEAFMKRCREYRSKRPVYVLETVFPGVIYNQKLAAEVVRYVEAVRKVWEETSLLALEADTLERVSGLEDKGGMIEKIFVEPEKIKGEKWLKGVFIVRMDESNPTKVKGVTEYPVLPYGAEKGFMAPTTSLVRVDVTPIAKNKSKRYRAAIEARARSRLASLKQAVDLAGFETLQKKLKDLAARPPLFTIF
ncbi:MAG: hypothetical protein GXP54_05970 [Deltaproteobacteria bacterium]|nr:hypothetical protein [Deltaproteobacteria bacterium]